MVAKKDRRPAACTLTCPASPTCRSCGPWPPAGAGLVQEDLRLAPHTQYLTNEGIAHLRQYPAPAPGDRACLSAAYVRRPWPW